MHIVKYRDSLLWAVRHVWTDWDAIWNAESGVSRKRIIMPPMGGGSEGCLADWEVL